jgi:O-succinylbenzoic acid--CoA ligase
MNPFKKYPGCTINGVRVDSQNIDSLTEDNSWTPNLKAGFIFLRELLNEENLLSVTTSGSTGDPKELSFPKSAFEQSAKATLEYFGLVRNHVAELYLPMKFIAAKMMVVRAYVGSLNLIIHEPSSSPEIGKNTHFAPLTAHQMDYILKSNQELNAKILLGGGTFDDKMLQRIKSTSLEVYSSFGMTETLSHFALGKIDSETQLPLKYTTLKGVVLKTDERSCAVVNWPGITEGDLVTNDMIELSEASFSWLGRWDNLINSGGIKIIPERVETLLGRKIEAPFFVHGLPHEVLGNEAVLFVESQSKVNIPEVNWDFPQQKPRRVVHVSNFLRTSSGKIRREATISQIPQSVLFSM